MYIIFICINIILYVMLIYILIMYNIYYIILSIVIILYIYYINSPVINSSNFILYTTLIIISISIVCYIFDYFNELVPVKSTYDGRTYYVQNLKDKINASNNLSIIRSRLIKIVFK